MTDPLKEWMKENLLLYKDMGMGRFSIDNNVFLEVVPTKGKILDLRESPTLILDDYATGQMVQGTVDYFVFEFGARFYYTPVNETTLKDLKLFRYIGQHDIGKKAHLMIHGKYEIMCGLHSYDKWIEKAKFLGYTTLGICEKNTLAGAVQFSIQCKRQGINPIVGISVDFHYDKHILEAKLYAAKKQGWENIMELNSQNKIFSHTELLRYMDGVLCIIVPAMGVDDNLLCLFSKMADKCYFQLSTVSFKHDLKEIERLDCIKWYIRESISNIPPILNNDTYCLEKDQQHLKDVLTTQDKKKTPSTTNHYFCSYDTMVSDFKKHFDDDTLFNTIIEQSEKSMSEIIDLAGFEIETGQRHLPEFNHHDRGVLFKSLIKDGFLKINFRKYDRQMVFDRIAREGKLIKDAGLIDYFLILWDIIKYCEQNKIEVGPGRGSAAGSLICYLLGITKINPFDYDLIFERFLNEGRMSELPDIDIDFASDRRGEVLEYVKEKYGERYFCHVGTYGTLKLKSAIKEINRYHNLLDFEHINYISKVISDDSESFFDLFLTISQTKNKRLIGFVRNNYALLHDVESVIGSLKNNSIHACATIIVPDTGVPIERRIPVRENSGEFISEWEGEELADMGYLKLDLLGLAQMMKINKMVDLVEKHHGTRIKTEEIPLNDSKVYDLFCRGHNGDVFHFGTFGLTSYLLKLQPRNMEDLIAAISLFRPGAMQSNAHVEYIELKNGRKQPVYDYMSEDITKDTYGLYVYQEQAMKAVEVLGGLSLTEADGVRKAMGKKIDEKMKSYERIFIQNAIKNGCPEDEAIHIWEKLKYFSGYVFNKSHAATYSVIGYWCNWFKANYPMEFWITTFEYAKDDDVREYLSEIEQVSDIKVLPPDINKSGKYLVYDLEKRVLYWDFDKVYFVGEKAAAAILEERERGGRFFSIEEFLHRLSDLDREKYPTNPVNKRVVENLILAGAFDQLHPDRYEVMKKLYEVRKEKLPEIYSKNAESSYFWPIQQYNICNLSSFNYRSILEKIDGFDVNSYITGSEFNIESVPKEVLVMGILAEYEIKQTKKGDNFALLKLLHNTDIINVRIWPSELNSDDNRLLFILDDTKEVKTLEQVLPHYQNNIVIIRGKLNLPDQWKDYNELVMDRYLQGELIKFLN